MPRGTAADAGARRHRRRPACSVVGVVSRDGEPQAESFAADAGTTFPSAFDGEGDLMAELGLNGLPYTMFLAADGTPRAQRARAGRVHRGAAATGRRAPRCAAVSAEDAAVADGLPEYLLRLLDAAVDLPLRHRMPQASATARRSAVLILFGEGPRGPDVLLIEKSAHLRSHAGQPAFPGGGVDPATTTRWGRRCARRRRRPASTRPACGCSRPCRSSTCRRRTASSSPSSAGGTTPAT